MPSTFIVFAITIIASLVIGAIVTSTYVSIHNKNNPDNKVSTLTITIMILSFVMLGIVAGFIWYYLSMKTGTPDSIVSKSDIINFEKAKNYILNYVTKVRKIPTITIREECADPQQSCYKANVL